MTASPDLPRGTVTFLFTDIEGSTRQWETDRWAMERAVQQHFVLLREAIERHGGVLFKVVGDAVQAAFTSAPQAVAAALEAQLAMQTADWGAVEPIRVRMALHAGEALPDERGDYLAACLNRLARMLSAGHGGQILLSEAVLTLARGQLPPESVSRDLGIHRLKDLLEPERITQLVHPHLPTDLPRLRTLDAHPHNLPVQPTAILGREREVAEVEDLLGRPEVRLVTLTGPGGTGKTRLALQVAAEVVEQVPDGVWFVPLAALTDPRLVSSTIAETLGVRDRGGHPLSDLLKDVLRDKDLLLVLDNFEQLLEAASDVQDLLAAAPGLRVLVTSRAPLRLRGEREYPVAPLSLPRRTPPLPPEQLSQYAAVRLFIERAQGVRPDFMVDAANAPAIAEICYRLDGLPLAIELAAARVRLLLPEAMLSRLERRLPLLTGGARDLPARQQTLRATIAWSHDLLRPDEQTLFRRLAVFAGGWTLEGAEAVGGGSASGEPGIDVLSALEALVEQSLVRCDEHAETEPRFTMLETIREFALEQLDASGETPELQRRHAEYFLQFTEQIAPKAIGSGRGQWLDRLDADLDNIRTALAWGLTHDPSQAAAVLIATDANETNNYSLWSARGHLAEGRRWAEQILSSPASIPPLTAAAVQRSGGWFALIQGDFDRAAALGDQALDAYRDADHRNGMALTLLLLGAVASSRGEHEQAIGLLEEVLALSQEVGDREVAMSLNNLAVAVSRSGDLDRAADLAREALATWRRLGDRDPQLFPLNLLGWMASLQGEHEQAVALLTEALALARAQRDDTRVAMTLGTLGDAFRRRGDRTPALIAIQETMQLYYTIGDTVGTAGTLESFALLIGVERPEVAARLFGAIDVLFRQVGYQRFPSQHAEITVATERIRTLLGEEAFTVAWAAGQAWPLRDAVAEVMSLAAELDVDDRQEGPANQG
jgi:predicted ATPase/class 3 adenylate cyclase